MSPSAVEKQKPGVLIPITIDTIPDSRDKVILITGGASGIGLSTVRLFQLKNAKGIVVVDFRAPSEEIFESLGETVLFVQTDVTSWESLSKAFQSAIDKFGTIDYVYANAGIGELDHLFVDKIEERTGQLIAPNYAAIDVNLKGVLSTVKLAVHWFRKQKVLGHIVMTSSMSGYETPGIPIYTASKHGVIGMLRAASLDLYDQFGICLNAVAPGPVVTNLIDSFAGRKATEKDKSTPEYEWETQQPDKPALAAAYLLTREQHGRSIAVHGGRYRDLESVYDAMRDELLGSQLGIPPVSERGWRNLFQCAFE